MDFYGTKLNGKPYYSPVMAEKRRKRWDEIKEGGHFKSSLTVPRADKSESQLGMIWGLLMAKAVSKLADRGEDTSLILGIDKPTGVGISERALCYYFYSACPIFNEAGERITLRDSNTEEASKFFSDVRNYMASQPKWGINIPDPNPNWQNETIGDNLE